MTNTDVSYELSEEYNCLRMRTGQNFVDAGEHQRIFTTQTVSQDSKEN